ncbi:hypothetical protein [Novosphingobium resinovorum]|uniref:hypothetical protein n=1 Tax=Novosphingobium resinovorum TaxID=158500 RepID=UPI0012EA8045|nr:hypothetical protein [Novosphingobium resinovorum]
MRVPFFDTFTFCTPGRTCADVGLRDPDQQDGGVFQIVFDALDLPWLRPRSRKSSAR